MNRFTVTLSAPSTDAPEQSVRRLRSFLKLAWRAFGLKCVELRAIDSSADAMTEADREICAVTNDRGSTGIGDPRKSRPYDERLIAQHAVTFGW